MLSTRGVAGIVRPACPRCGRVVRIDKPLDGQRVCRTCIAHTRIEECARCGARREPATRDEHGRPLCPNCLVTDPTISKSASTAVAAVRSASAALVGQSRHRRPRARSRDERNKLTHKHLDLKASSTRSETPATVSPTTRSSFASRSPPCRRPTSRCETNETATAWPAKRSLARCTC